MLSHSVIKLNHMEIHCDDMEWIQVARYMGQGLHPVTVVTNILTVPGCPSGAQFTAPTDAEATTRIPKDQLAVHLPPC
jgi:hypothetical protein